jgi:hypothetical protein
MTCRFVRGAGGAAPALRLAALSGAISDAPILCAAMTPAAEAMRLAPAPNKAAPNAIGCAPDARRSMFRNRCAIVR